MSVNKVLKRFFVSASLVLVSMGITLAILIVLNVGNRQSPVAKTEITPSNKTAKTKTETAPKHVYSLPERLVIPKLEVDTSVLPMGLTSTGAMQSPKTNEDTGWYSLGTRPGNTGSAVIAGHLGLKNDAVFGKLHLLAVGDTISIVDNQKAKANFVVRSLKTYDKDSDTVEIFNSKYGSHLNLITCNGDWDTVQDTYEKRLVVFTEKI